MPTLDNDDVETTPANTARRRVLAPSFPRILFHAASVYSFNIAQASQPGPLGIVWLTYVVGEIFDIVAEQGELWLAINQDDGLRRLGWIWNRHFARLIAEE